MSGEVSEKNMQPIDVSTEDEGELAPHELIPESWRKLLEEEGADIEGIEWWETPNILFTMGKQGFSRPMILFWMLIIGIPLVFIISFPLNIIVASNAIDKLYIGLLLSPIFIFVGVFLAFFFILYNHFLAESSFSVGALGWYFYAATPHSFIIGYKALPIPKLSARLPSSVTVIPYGTKYFRGDIRYNSSGGLLLPSINMTVEQKKQCLGGKGGFLYVKNMQVLLSYLHSSGSGVTDVTPVKISYAPTYAKCNFAIGIILFISSIITTLFPLFFYTGLFCLTFFTFTLFPLILSIIFMIYGVYWQKHLGLIHFNSPPNPEQTPEPLAFILFQKARRAMSHR